MAGDLINDSTLYDSDSNNKMLLRVINAAGTDINPKAKFLEVVYTNSNKTVTYNFYESSSKVTLYNTVTMTFTKAQNTEFLTASWV
jgi:hypothetical protein